MVKKKEAARQELEIHIPITIHSSEKVNLHVLNDSKITNKIRSAVLSGLTLPAERGGRAENMECEIGTITVGPKGVYTRTLRVSGS